MPDADVIVVGGGIAGLGAALRLRELGLTPLVLETERRVGGRMTSDRVDGFVIDRGVTLLGNRFRSMRRLVAKVGLAPLVVPVDFALGIEDAGRRHTYRARRAADILLGRGLSFSARRTGFAFFADLLRHARALEHGRSDRAESIDRVDCLRYLEGLGRGGRELFEKLFDPGLRTAVGGALDHGSRAVLMQTVWNTLGGGFWNLTDGVDRIPEAAAARLDVLTGALVRRVTTEEAGIACEVEVDGRSKTLRARGAILAVPGDRVAGLCDLPPWIGEPLSRTRYSRIVSAHVALSQAPSAPWAGYGFVHPPEGLGVFELEHNRAPGRCPPGRGMISVYFADSPGFRPIELADATLRERAVDAVEGTFPETRGKTLFVHLIRWETAIPLFPPGRMSEMAGLRRALGGWKGPIDFCGDYLDGLSSEGALRTGEQAAQRWARRRSPRSR